jgi:ABC-type Fe2+-enterobactin transport system substrate-binding protein
VITPRELRLLALQWRHIASAAHETIAWMKSVGVEGAVVLEPDVVLAAIAKADELDERAANLERMAAS